MVKIEKIAPYILLLVVLFIVIRYTIPLVNEISIKNKEEPKIEIVEKTKYVEESEVSVYERMDKEFEEKKSELGLTNREEMYEEIRKQYE